MSTVDSMTPKAGAKEPPLTTRAAAGPTRVRVRGTPATWIKRGGLSKLLFLLPLLLVFGAFSWYPIVRLVTMSLQHTNLVLPATWVGSRTSRR